MKIKNVDKNFHFLQGEGEMAKLIREKNWDTTSLGNPINWPQSLRMAVSMMLNSKFPMFIFWGAELTCLYNDAYRPSLGQNGKHPSILGIPAELAWKEIWHIIKPLLDQVIATGEGVLLENLLIPFYRNGTIEDIFWTFSYNPIFDEAGKTVAILTICTETTAAVNNIKKLQESESRLRLIISQAPLSIAIFRGSNYVTEIANSRSLEIWGRKENEILKQPIFEAVPEMFSQRINELFDDVFKTGKRYHNPELSIELMRNGRLETAYINFSLDPLYNANGTIEGLIATGFEITEQVLGHKKIKASEQKLNIAIEGSELGTWELNFKTGDIQFTDRYLEILGFKKGISVSHAQIIKLIHPDDLPIRTKAMELAMKSGILYFVCRLIWNDFSIHWIEAKGKVFYDDTKEPSYMLGTIRDITQQKEYQQKLEDNDAKINLIMEASNLGFWNLNLITKEFYCNERCFEMFDQPIENINSNEQILKYIYPKDLIINESTLTELNATQAINYETRVRFKDHSIHFIENNGKIYFDENNQPSRILGTSRDITEDKKTQQQLEEREKRFRILADTMPIQVWIADVEGNLNYFNKTVHEFSGIPTDELINQGWLQMVHPDDHEENIKVWSEAINTGNDFLMEHRFRMHTGAYRWQLSRAIPVRDEHEKIVMWVGTSTDIHDQKAFANELENQVAKRTEQLNQLNETLKKSEQQYHLMVEEVQGYSIIYLNKNGIIENWNAGAEKIKGYKPAEIIGKSFSVFYTEKDRNDNLPQKLITQAKQCGRAVQEGWRIRKDSSLFWASVVITALHNEHKEVIGFSKVTHDLTERKKVQDQLQKNSFELEERNKELKKMVKELESFNYISSHDLQEPLRKIRSFSKLIIQREHHGLSENAKNYFSRMQDAALRMQNLINDLLAYSRTNTNDRKFEMKNLHAIVDEVKMDLKEELQQKNAIIETNVNCEVRVISFQVKQLLINLISNSLKFSKPDLAPVIKIKSKIDTGENFKIEKLILKNNYCHIQYSDNGIGFDQEYSERIFGLFQRLHDNSNYAGTGIGLSIVKKIVENHNGLIAAHSELGNGATFEIYLPLH